MPTADEINKVFSDNGIDMDSLNKKMESALSSGEYTEEELRNAILEKYNSLVGKPSTKQKENKSTEYKSPGWIKGTSRAFASGATADLDPYIAGVTNMTARRVGGVIGGVLDKSEIQLKSGLVPTLEQQLEYYGEGKETYLGEQQAFAKEHPILYSAGKILGTITGIALSGGVGAIPKIAKLGTFGQRALSSAKAFGTYESIKGLANEGEGLSPTGAIKGLGKGAVEGAVFSGLSGSTAIAEQALLKMPLVRSAAEMSGLVGKATKFGVGATGAAAEGALVAQAASATEKAFGSERDLLPTKEEVLAGMLGVGAIRGIGAAFQKAGGVVSKIKEPTQREIAAPVSKNIEAEIRSLNKEKASLRGKPYQEKRIATIETRVAELKKELQPIVNTSEKDIEAIAEESGWTKGKTRTDDDGDTFVSFSKDGKDFEVRISSRQGKGGKGVVDYDLTKKPEENFPKIADAFAEAENLKAGEKLPTVKGQLESVVAKLEPTQEQIAKIKNKANQKVSDEVAREIAISENKELAIASAERRGKAMLPLGERVRRTIGAIVRKAGNVLDSYSPVGATHKLKAKITGETTPLSETGDFISKQRDRGGRVQVRQKSLVDDFEREQQTDNFFVQKLQSYMEAKKNEDMLPQSIERLKANNKNGKNDSEIARQETLLQRSKETASAIEASEKRVVSHAQKQWDYGQEQLDELYQIGRIGEEEYNLWKNNKHYVHSEAALPGETTPLDILGGDEIETLNKQSGLSDAFKRYKGYEGGYNNLVISNLAQGKRVAYLADTQRAMKAWVKDALITGEASPAQGFEYLKPGQYPSSYNPERQIFIWENGKAKVFDVPRDVAKAFNPTYKEENFLLKNLRLTNNLFKLGTTGISTGFSAMNLIRDMQSVVGGSRSGMFFRPSYVKTAAELYGPGSSKLTGAKKELRDLIDSKLGSEFSLADTQLDLDRTQLTRVNNLLEAQGKANKPGTFIGDTMALLLKTASKAKEPAEKTFQGLAKTLSFLGNWSEKIGRTTVFLTELRRQAGSEAAFEAMMKNPKLITKTQADNAAKEMTEVTLDFNRKMNPTIEGLNRYAAPYFKPSLLGAQRVWKVLTDPEIAPQAWRWIGTIGVLQGLVRAEMNEAQRKKYESQFNPEISAKNLSIVNKDGVITTIPANQEFGGLYQWIAAGTEYLVRKMKGKEARERAWDEVNAAIAQLSQNVIPGGYLLEPSNLAPTPVGKMILEESINKDIYSKTDIESAAMRRLPVEERFSASTPRIYRLMSKYLKVGDLQSSPKMWEHRAKKLGSSFAKEMADVTDLVLEYAGIGEEEWNLPKRIEEGSIMSRFFNKDYTAYARNVQEYDKEMKELEQAYNSYKKNPKASSREKKEMASIYQSLKLKDQQRINKISDNQKLLSNLRRKGYSEWQRYLNGEITKEQFKKSKKMESAKVASKYYENQKKISDATDKLLQILREKKKKKGLK